MGATFARRAGVVAGTVMTLVMSACGGGSGSDDDAAAAEESSSEAPRQTLPKPTAPAGTAPPAATSSDLLDLLPKAKDIGALQLGIPAVAAIRSMAAEFPAETAGPCGGTLTPLDLEGAAGRTYDTVKGRIYGIGLARTPETETFVSENLADLDAGCTGLEIVDISAVSPDGAAWITPADAGSKAIVLLQTAELTIIVSFTSPEPIDAALVQSIATVWNDVATGAA